MKRKITLILIGILTLSSFTGCSETSTPETSATQTVTSEATATPEQTATPTPEKEEKIIEETKEAETEEVVEAINVNIVALKGPTAMGMIEFMNDADNEVEFMNDYNFSMTAATDEVTAALVKGEVDISAIPANLASVLYNNTNGGVQVIAINTLGVLYILENGDTVTDIESLRGQTIVSAGKGGTPEMSLRYILSENGIDPDTDVTIEWKSEQSECLAYLAATPGAIAMMPEPFVTTALLANEAIEVKLDLTKEWDKTQEGSEDASSLITGVVVARTEFIEENETAVIDFLEKYKKSVDFVNSDIEAAATLIGEYGITPYETAVVAISNCNIVYIDGEEMHTALEGYLTVLHEQNPASVGGALPLENFYYEQ